MERKLTPEASRGWSSDCALGWLLMMYLKLHSPMCAADGSILPELLVRLLIFLVGPVNNINKLQSLCVVGWW